MFVVIAQVTYLGVRSSDFTIQPQHESSCFCLFMLRVKADRRTRVAEPSSSETKTSFRVQRRVVCKRDRRANPPLLGTLPSRYVVTWKMSSTHYSLLVTFSNSQPFPSRPTPQPPSTAGHNPLPPLEPAHVSSDPGIAGRAGRVLECSFCDRRGAVGPTGPDILGMNLARRQPFIIHASASAP